jgi:CubicO group peptidase (beta-lactamase class C family)
VAVVRDGRLAYAEGFGLRDVRRRLAADSSTRYGIGSVTKTIVAVLVLRLVEQRRLGLDDELVRWLPYFTAARGVRVRDLLAQRSGIPDYDDAGFLLTVLPAVLPGHVDRDAVLHSLARRRPEFPPGTAFEYSNANYLVLGAIAERATGAPLPALLRGEVFERAGMRDSELGDSSGPDDAVGYTKGPLGPVAAGAWDWGLTYSAGGVRSTAVDLARFDVALFAGRLISQRSFAQMAPPDASAASAYGFGTFAYSAAATTVFWHDGTVLGFKAMNVFVPANRNAVVVLANADYARAPADGFAIAAIAYGSGRIPSEPFDPNLPRWSEAIGAASAAVLLIVALALRRRLVTATIAALLAYAGAAIWLPAGFLFFGAGAVAVAWPRRTGPR